MLSGDLSRRLMMCSNGDIFGRVLVLGFDKVNVMLCCFRVQVCCRIYVKRRGKFVIDFGESDQSCGFVRNWVFRRFRVTIVFGSFRKVEVGDLKVVFQSQGYGSRVGSCGNSC